MDNSREECLPQTAVAKISAHAAGKGYPRLTFAGSVADADLCKGAGLAEGKSGSKWLRSSTRRSELSRELRRELSKIRRYG